MGDELLSKNVSDTHPKDISEPVPKGRKRRAQNEAEQDGAASAI